MDDSVSTTSLEGKEFKHGSGEDAITVSPADIPTVSLFALAQRGFSHVLGNEVASKLAAFRKTEAGAAADEAEVAEFVKAKRNEALEKILNGTLGVRSATAPRVTGLEALMRRVAVEFLQARFAAYSKKAGVKVSLPTGDKVVEVAGRAMTREQLIEAELKRNGEQIKAEALRRQGAAGDDEDEAASLDDLLA
jgi:hypothetical protein